MDWTHQADVLLIELVARGAQVDGLKRHLLHLSDTVTEEEIATRVAVMARTETMMRAAIELRGRFSALDARPGRLREKAASRAGGDGPRGRPGR